MKLWHKVVIGLLGGIVCGLILKDKTEYIKPVGTLFINLIKMVIVPLIFFSLVSGITSMGDSKTFGRIGLKAFLAFNFTTIFAVTIGLAAGTFFHPGLGVKLNFHPEAVSASVPKTASLSDIIVNMVPINAFGAMAEGNILQVVVFAVFTGVALNLIGDKGKAVVELIHSGAALVFKMIDMVIRFSPYGVFALTAWVVGTQGLDILVSLGKLVMTVVVACFFQYILFGVFIYLFARISPFPFYKKMVEPQSLAFSTSSSKATLATAIKTLQEKMGVSKGTSSFVLPLGASINMDGTAIYLGICALFFAQATGTTLHAHDYFVIIFTSTIASIGAAGIPGGALIMMGMVLSSVGLPLDGIALIAGVDRILDMLRTTVNITGDSTITLIVDKSEGALDTTTYFAKNT